MFFRFPSSQEACFEDGTLFLRPPSSLEVHFEDGARAASALAGNEHSASSPQSSNAEIARNRRAMPGGGAKRRLTSNPILKMKCI